MTRRFAWLVMLLFVSGGAAAADGAQAASPPYDHVRYADAISKITGALATGDFDLMEQLHRELLKPGARTVDGTWMLQAFARAFEVKFRHDAPGNIESLLASWKARHPASALRPVAEAIAWQQRAWMAKGTGCYAGTSSAGRKAFEMLLDRSAVALREAEASGKSSPLWHVTAILVAGGQARPAQELDGLLEAALRLFPAYEPIYAARMTFLLPEWGGDFERLDQFVRGAASATHAVEGSALYTWLYLEVAASAACAQLFEQSRVSWPEMKAGFEDMIERHRGNWNRNVFATFACRMRDRETTAALLLQLGKEARLGAFTTGVNTESCRRFALDRAALL